MQRQENTIRSERMRDFYRRVYEIVSAIPFGMVTTYGYIGRALGAKSSARMVGYALRSLPQNNQLPCHRVVNRNGELSGKIHFEPHTLMRELLEAENVAFVNDAVDMEKHLWIPPLADDPD